MTVVTLSGKEHPGWIDYTPTTTYLTTSSGYLPGAYNVLKGVLHKLHPNIVNEQGDIQIGPIPKGTPINLVSNIDLEKEGDVVNLLFKIKHTLDDLGQNPTDEQAAKAFLPMVPDLLNVSKCKDFVVNKGHYFGTDFLPASEGETGLSDADKKALIEFLKTL